MINPMNELFPYSFGGERYPGMGYYNYRTRVASLLPAVRAPQSGETKSPRFPRKVRIYDAGDRVADRYTAVFWGDYTAWIGEYVHLAMSANPYHPQGVSQLGFSQTLIDRHTSDHLGGQISFFDLPADCQYLVMEQYLELWGLRGYCVHRRGTWADSGLTHYIKEAEAGQVLACSKAFTYPIVEQEGLVNCPDCAMKMLRIIRQGWTTAEGEDVLL